MKWINIADGKYYDGKVIVIDGFSIDVDYDNLLKKKKIIIKIYFFIFENKELFNLVWFKLRVVWSFQKKRNWFLNFSLFN